MIPLLVFVLMAAIVLLSEAWKREEERIPISANDISLRQDSKSIYVSYVNREANRLGCQGFDCSLVELIRDKQYNMQPEIIVVRNGLKNIVEVELHLPEETRILQSP